MLHILRKAQSRVFSLLFPTAHKRREELEYWRGRYAAEDQQLSNAHYEPLYTVVFGLTRDDFAGKAVLDVGCGPRGSLEWADMTRQRVGLDPLVPRYLKLGANRHKMQYSAAPSENIPFPDGHFDIVTCLNALDHVDDFAKTVSEIKRVTRPGGLFLLSTEIDHPPTATEPVTLSDGELLRFGPEFSVLDERRVGTPDDHILHQAVLSGSPPYQKGKPGIYVAKMVRS
jgi:2-polyprenyl-3-methyl-5-hydroxy-6-metoxy-1,4-benzoquinol methylase